MLSFISSNNLVTLNQDEPTLISPSGSFSSIDVSIISPQLSMEMEWFIHSDRLGSNHLPVCLAYREDDITPITHTSYNVKQANWNSFTNSVNLEIIGDDINDKCIKITQDIIKAADDNIPKKSPYINGKLKVPWWSNDIRAALTKRNRALRHYKTNRNPELTQSLFIAYKKTQAEAKRLVKSAKRSSWQSFVSKINRNTTATEVWNTVRAINGRKCKIGARYLRIGGRMQQNPRIIANTIGNTFQSNSVVKIVNHPLLKTK